jgi:hypothetical protein
VWEDNMSKMRQAMATEVIQTKDMWAAMAEAIGEMRGQLAETRSALAAITRDRRERIEELERQLNIETELPQDP